MTRLAAVVLLLIVAAAACGSDGSSDSSASSASRRSSPIVATDVAPQAGLAEATVTHGENCVADFDNDGTLDVLLSTHAEKPWPLMRGLPDGRFEPWPGWQLERRDRHGCAVADFNRDGLLDVYLSIGACKGRCTAPKELWIQQADRTFVDEAAQWGVSDPQGRGREPVVLNANGDDLPDLYTGQEQPVKYRSLNKLWINRGDHFELQRGPQTNDLGNLCSAAADIDRDGLDEIALCTPFDGFFVYRNKDGTFVKDTESFGLDDFGRFNVKFADVNGDRRPDLASIGARRVQVFLNDHGRYGEPTLEQDLTLGMDVAFGDVDGDRDLDLYVQHGSGNQDVVYLNGGDGRFAVGPKLPRPEGGVAVQSAGAVGAIPNWKGTGRDAFLVNNSGQDVVAGNRQLFEFSGG